MTAFSKMAKVQVNGNIKRKAINHISKKSRMGSIHAGFHFLSVNYLGTQLQDITNVAHSNDEQFNMFACYLTTECIDAAPSSDCLAAA